MQFNRIFEVELAVPVWAKLFEAVGVVTEPIDFAGRGALP